MDTQRYAETVPFSTIVELLRWRATQQPGQLAYKFLVDGEAQQLSLTYAELDARCRTIAAQLQDLRLAGEPVLLLHPPGLDYVAAFFGCLYAGAIAVPLYPPRPNRSLARIQSIATDAHAAVALTTRAILSKAQRHLVDPPGTASLKWLVTDEPGKDLPTPWQDPGVRPETLAILQYTSGSTATPKGVMITHGNLLHNSNLISRCFEISAESRIVSWLPPHHDMGLIGGLLQPLYRGIPVTLLPAATFLQRPLRWLQAISYEKATISGGPNFAFDLCLRTITPEQRDTLDLRPWSLAFCGAEPIRPETLQRFTEYFEPCGFRYKAFSPCYGLAEATLLVTGGVKADAPKLASFHASALQQNRVVESAGTADGRQTLVGCGVVPPGEQIVFADPESLSACSSDRVGELWVASPSVAAGYWNRPRETEQTFRAYLSNTGQGPFLRTGDLGFIHDGELFLTGRLKDLIIIRGRNYHPLDVEMAAQASHEALRFCPGAAFSVNVEGEERLVIVHEIQRSYKDLEILKVARAVSRAVAEDLELELFAFVAVRPLSIPKTSSGKIQRYACRNAYLAGTLETVGQWILATDAGAAAPATGEGVSPHHRAGSGKPSKRGDIQSWLACRLAEIAGIEPSEIDLRQPFSGYGLDSLKAISISGALEEWLGRRLSPTLLWDFPNIESLARHLAGEPPVSIASSTNRKSLAHEREPVAIIGVGCRFPAAESPQDFWRLLQAGVCPVSDVPKGRWKMGWADEVSPEIATTVSRGGFLEQVDRFDAPFFAISPREAVRLDPQQRLLLEVTWEALETGGLSPEKMCGTLTGVFVGISSNDYGRLLFTPGIPLEAYTATGNALSIAANRLSYVLGLQGPSLAVDTACSSSLVAVHLACQSLRTGECDVALAGGVNLILSPELSVVFSNAQMLSPDGRCKTFDASADGYGRGEGCGVVVLKRWSEAVRDGDRVLALIRGSATNQDGRSNGLTAPNGQAQQAVMEAALAGAGVAGCEVGYVEAHGTGTPLGDPIEMGALARVYGRGRPPEEPLLVGSVKTNLGHLEAAAGVAGLIKVVLALQHGEIPPHLHFETPNPHIRWEELAVEVATGRRAWPGHGRRMAGISSFGFGGTNAHLIVEAAPEQAVGAGERERRLHLLSLSAREEGALRELAGRWAQHLGSHPGERWADVAYTANTGRSHFARRLAVLGETAEEGGRKLAAAAAGQESAGLWRGKVEREGPGVVFLFTGQGSQGAGMGRELYETQPGFRQSLQHCEELLREELEAPLLEVLYGEETGLLQQTRYAQPALFALEYSLAKLWRSWGIEPGAVFGHSVGEYVAACVAGVFSLEEGLRLISARGRLMQEAPAGEMAAVFAGEERVAAALAGYTERVSIAAVNAPAETVISGEREGLQEVIGKLQGEGLRVRRLGGLHAFHSPLMEGVQEAFGRVAEGVSYGAPQRELIAGLSGRSGEAEMGQAGYWRRQLREAVRFSAGMQTLQEMGYRVYVEVGPQPVLLGIARRCVSAEAEALWLPSLRSGRSDWEQMLESLAALYVQGVAVDWQGFDQDYARQKLALPTYAFQRRRYWMEESGARPRVQAEPASPNRVGPLLGRRVSSALPERLYETELSAGGPSYLSDHRIQGQAVWPAAGTVEMVLAAGREAWGAGALALEEVVLEEALLLPEGEPQTVQLIVRPGSGEARFELFRRVAGEAGQESWRRHAQGKLRPGSEHAGTGPEELEGCRARCGQELAVQEYYGRLRERGLEYGSSFQGIVRLWRGAGEALGQIQLPEAVGEQAAGYQLHPVLLDAGFQLLGAALGEEQEGGTYVPVGLERVELRGTGAAGKGSYWSQARLRPEGAGSRALTGDIRLFEAGGAVVAEVSGLRLQRLEGQPRLRSSPAGTGEGLYEVRWQAQPAQQRAERAEAGGPWLILADRGGTGAALAERLRARGESCEVVWEKEGEPAWEPLLSSAGAAGWRGIVHLWSLDEAWSAEAPLEPAAGTGSAAGVVQLVQALARTEPPPRLWLVTRNAQPVTEAQPPVELSGAAAWGLGPVIALEHRELGCVRVDLEAGGVAEGEAAALERELGSPASEDQVAFRGGLRYVARLQASGPGEGEQPVRLESRAAGVLENLEWRPLVRRPPAAGELEIRVQATGLNFRDVLNALGLYPGEAGPLGGECAGRIVALGAGVEGFSIGQAVVALAPGSFASHVTVDARLVAAKPEGLSFEQAAAVPIAFLTAHCALLELAGLRSGERVLLHAASGGVGLAALQLAQRAGAQVYATASPGKWEALRALGVEQVMTSRSLDFAPELQQRTGGRGVDLVLNSLSGEFIPHSLAALAPGGRFVEIGKRDIWDAEQVARLRPDVRYFVFDLQQAAQREPERIGAVLCELLRAMQAGTLRPVRQTWFPRSQAEQAFRHMAQARHIGKIVVAQQPAEAPRLRADATYLITGGLGALGLQAAVWMIEQGARHLILVGRHPASSAARQILTGLERQGARIVVAQADVTQWDALSRVLHENSSLPALKGVLHAAGILDDGLLRDLNAERLAHVMAPKLAAWNLHLLTRDRALDFFVLFSSAASVLGSPGQANYAAGNAFLDALAHHRHAHGLPALSINWGPWAGAGMAASRDGRDRARRAAHGLEPIAPERALRWLGTLLSRPQPQLAVLPVSWPRFLAQYPAGAQPPLLAGLAGSSASPSPGPSPAGPAPSPLLATLRQAPPHRRRSLLVSFISEQVAKVLGLDPSQFIDPTQPLNEFGLDSLMAVELKNLLVDRLGDHLPDTLLFDYPAIETIADYLLRPDRFDRLAEL